MDTQKSGGIVLNRRSLSIALMVAGLILAIISLVTQAGAMALIGSLAVVVVGFLFYRRSR